MVLIISLVRKRSLGKYEKNLVEKEWALSVIKVLSYEYMQYVYYLNLKSLETIKYANFRLKIKT